MLLPHAAASAAYLLLLLPHCCCCSPSSTPSCCFPVPQEPEAATEGLGGTYFFANEAGQKIAIMKPCDEEPLAPNNPKGFVGRQLGEPGLKPTVRVGEAASREVRARAGALGDWLGRGSRRCVVAMHAS